MTASALVVPLTATHADEVIAIYQAGIFPENAASLTVHEQAGLQVIGTRERIGRHHGAWRDVVLVERRSPAVS